MPASGETPAPLTEPAGLSAGPPELTAESYILMDAATGQVLAEKAPDLVCYPASVTKVLTLALVLESCGDDLSAPLTVSESAIEAVGPGSSSIFLRPGETLTLEDAVEATLLESANDAANVIAEYAAGSIEAFVARMNAKAAELGLQSTHFVNPSGYHDDGNRTTARELAQITRWALSIPGFAQLLGHTEHTMPGNELHPAPRYFVTDNLLLLGTEPYPGLLGGKSGWTPEAHFTMMEAAERDGHTLIAITLACPRKAERYTGCAALLDYGFTHFAPAAVDAAALGLPDIPVLREGKLLGEVPLDAAAELLLPENVPASGLRVEYLGPPAYTAGEEFFARAAVYAPDGALLAELDATPRQQVLDRLLADTPKPPWDKRGLRPILFLALMIVLGAYFLNQGSRQVTDQRRQAARRRLQKRLTKGYARIERLERERQAEEEAAGTSEPESGPQDR